jgi:TPR repeat protein
MKTLHAIVLLGLMVGQYWRAEAQLPDLAQIKLAAEKGDAKAQFDLGKTYRNRGDSENAEKWFRLAAGQGHAEAEFAYGECLMIGLHQRVDGKLKRGAPEPSQAASWFAKAAAHGYPRAYQKLGDLYRDGKGVRQSNTEAYKYYTIADKLGQPLAKHFRDQLILKMTSQEISLAQQAAETFLNSLPKR